MYNLILFPAASRSIGPLFSVFTSRHTVWKKLLVFRARIQTWISVEPLLFLVLSLSVESDSLQTQDCSPPGSCVHGESPGQNTGVGCHALLQGVFPTQRPNPLHVDSLPAEPPGKPKNTGVGSLSLLQGNAWPRNQAGVSLQTDSLPTELPRKPSLPYLRSTVTTLYCLREKCMWYLFLL